MFSQLRSDDGRHILSPKSLVHVPTGISSLDAILGGGLPLGSLVLIEEDDHGIYSGIISKCFLSEGIANADSVFLACRDQDPQGIINKLPQAVPKKEEIPKISEGELKIAWRYQNNQQVMSVPSLIKNQSASHEFDFSEKLKKETINKSDISIWPKNDSSSNLCELFQDIFNFISSRNSLKECRDNRKLTRVFISSIGSPFWSFDIKSIHQFFFKLRAIVHNSYSIAVITIPSNLFQSEVLNKCKQLSDIVFSLKSFLNCTEQAFNDFNGLIKLQKISAINSFSIHVPEDIDWAFKVKKKKLIIEKLHLPPENAVTGQREQDDLASVFLPNCQLNF